MKEVEKMSLPEDHPEGWPPRQQSKDGQWELAISQTKVPSIC